MRTEERRRTGIGCFAPRERLVHLLRRMAAIPLDEAAGLSARGNLAAVADGAIPAAAVGFFIARTATGWRLMIFERHHAASSEICRPAGDLLQEGKTLSGAMPWTSAGST